MKTSVSGINEGVDSTLASAISKVKRHVLPLFVIMFIVNYIDRVNIGFVRTHMEHDLGIGAAAYGFGAGLFFIGYALFEVPSNMLLQKVGARIWLTRIMLTWAWSPPAWHSSRTKRTFTSCAFCLAWPRPDSFPGDLLLHSLATRRRTRQGHRDFPQWFGGGLADLRPIVRPAVADQRPGHARLAMDVLHRGMFSVGLCVFVWFWLDAKPHDAKWLTRAEQDALVSAIDDEQKAREAATPIRPSMAKLLKDRQIILFCLIYFLSS